MASFKSTEIRRIPTFTDKANPDAKVWDNYEFPVTRKENSGITHLDVQCSSPYNIAVTTSLKVQIVSSDTCGVVKNLTRFHCKAHSGCFRRDGRLLVAGDQDGFVHLYDTETKGQLRLFKGHTKATHVTRPLFSGQKIFSGSDDSTVRLWDVAAETEVMKYKEHSDYVRSGAASLSNSDLFVTGGYDHVARVWDGRSDESVLKVDHGSPVEAVLLHPNGTLLFTAGGNFVICWDVLTGGRKVFQTSHHHKTVTSLAFSSNYSRLVSGSLDRHVKIYEVTSGQLAHSLDYPSAILSLAMTPDDSALIVGMSDGLLSIRKKKPPKPTAQEKLEAKLQKKRKANFRYAMTSYAPTETDAVISKGKKPILAKHDKLLKRFQYTAALDVVLELRVRTRQPEVTVGVMKELIRRDGLRIALAGRDDKNLGGLLKFIQKNISNVKYMSVLLDVANITFDIYRSEINQLPTCGTILTALKDTVDNEANYMKELLEIMGAMDTILTASDYQHNSASETQTMNLNDNAGSLESATNNTADMEVS